MTQEQHLNVGKIVGAHGIRGEVRVLSQTDFPDSTVRERQQAAALCVRAPTNRFRWKCNPGACRKMFTS